MRARCGAGCSHGVPRRGGRRRTLVVAVAPAVARGGESCVYPEGCGMQGVRSLRRDEGRDGLPSTEGADARPRGRGANFASTAACSLTRPLARSLALAYLLFAPSSSVMKHIHAFGRLRRMTAPLAVRFGQLSTAPSAVDMLGSPPLLLPSPPGSFADLVQAPAQRLQMAQRRVSASAQGFASPTGML
eukprot:124088-Chlamydomonas_euryale.AAC.5